MPVVRIRLYSIILRQLKPKFDNILLACQLEPNLGGPFEFLLMPRVDVQVQLACTLERGGGSHVPTVHAVLLQESNPAWGANRVWRANDYKT